MARLGVEHIEAVWGVEQREDEAGVAWQSGWDCSCPTLHLSQTDNNKTFTLVKLVLL